MIRPAHIAINQQHPLARGLLTAYVHALPGANHIHDSGVLRNHGVITDGLGTWDCSGDLNRIALTLDGSTERVKAVCYGAYPPYWSDWTISIWAVAPTVDQQERIAYLPYDNSWTHIWSSPKGYLEIRFRYEGGYGRSLYVRGYNGSGECNLGIASDFYGKFVHVAVVCRSGYYTTYLNGSSANTGVGWYANTKEVAYLSENGTQQPWGIFLGGSNDYYTYNEPQYLSATHWSDFLYWSRALDDREIQQLAVKDDLYIGGLLVPEDYRALKAAAAPPAGSKAWWLARPAQLLAGGV
ncbi:MAG: hypothetical protein ACOY3P_03500 [Planctomycetota bacterium]